MLKKMTLNGGIGKIFKNEFIKQNAVFILKNSNIGVYLNKQIQGI
jgi:hypothetical protein